MCIIAIKPENTPIDWGILDTCEFANPDGGGYAYAEGGKVHIRKGFFTNKHLKHSLKQDGIDTTKTLIMFHYRIATHGKVAPATCHPFPITKDTAELCELDVSSDMAIAHNGIIPAMPNDRLLSDTMQYIRLFIEPLGEKVLAPAIQALIAHGSTSKLALLTPDGVHLMGHFIDDPVSGWLFSNDSFEPMVYQPKNHSRFSLSKSKSKKKAKGKSKSNHAYWDSINDSVADFPEEEGLTLAECDGCLCLFTIATSEEPKPYLDAGEYNLCDACVGARDDIANELF